MHIIYSIKNKVNGKEYIGRSCRTFEERYYKGKWWRYTSNDKLRSAYRKYGKENFEVSIVETVNTLEESISREIFHIKNRDTYKNGYNKMETILNSRLYPKKYTNNTNYIYTLLNLETNEVFTSDSFIEIENKIKYSRSWIQNSISIERVYGKWKVLEIFRKNNIWKQKYIIYNVKNKKWFYDTPENIYKYLKNINAYSPHVCSVLKGSRKISKNWILYSNKNCYKRLPKKGKKKYIIIFPNGEKKEISDVPNFCRKNKLRYDSLLSVLGGKRKQYNGYRLPESSPYKIIKHIEIYDKNKNLVKNVKNVQELCIFFNICGETIYQRIRKKIYTYGKYDFKIIYKYNYDIN